MNYYVLHIIFLGIFTIFLPPEKSDARLNPTITVLLGFIFLQTIIASNGPKSEQNLTISTFTEVTLCLSLMNLAFCALCEGLGAISDDRPMPRLMRWSGYPILNITYRRLRITYYRLNPIINIIKGEIIRIWHRLLQFRKAQVENISAPISNFNAKENESLDGILVNKKETNEVKGKIHSNEIKGIVTCFCDFFQI